MLYYGSKLNRFGARDLVDRRAIVARNLHRIAGIGRVGEQRLTAVALHLRHDRHRWLLYLHWRLHHHRLLLHHHRLLLHHHRLLLHHHRLLLRRRRVDDRCRVRAARRTHHQVKTTATSSSTTTITITITITTTHNP
jgi:hypothetical protein